MSAADAGRGSGERGSGEPQVQLLDARRLGLDEAGLRRAARAAQASGVERVTRSYRYPYAMLAAHSQPVGIDIERLEPCDEMFAATICTPGELPTVPCGPDRDAFLISLWSSKEALTKALGDAIAYDPRRIESPMSWPGGRSGPWRARQLPAPSGHVAWLCWRES